MHLTIFRALGLCVVGLFATVLPVVGGPVHPRSPTGIHATNPENEGALSCNIPMAKRLLGEEKDTKTKGQSLHKRAGLDVVHAESLRVIVPAQLAVPGLKLFYSTLMALVEHESSCTKPAGDFSMVMGNLQLQLSSATPIAWDFVGKFAQKMLNAAVLGFAGTYDILYADEDVGRMITITLRVIDHATGLEIRSVVPEDSQDAPNLLISTIRPARISSKSSTRASHSRDQASKKLRSVDKRVPGARTFDRIAFNVFTTIPPLAIAVLRAQAFYESVRNTARNEQWQPSPSSSLFTIQQGVFQLTVSCLGGAVPMALLHNFVEEMLTYASRGWLPLYDVHYEDRTTGRVVAFALRILDNTDTSGTPLLPQLPGPSKKRSTSTTTALKLPLRSSVSKPPPRRRRRSLMNEHPAPSPSSPSSPSLASPAAATSNPPPHTSRPSVSNTSP